MIEIEEDFGSCECGGTLEPIWFIEKQYNRIGLPTGYVRQQIDVLVCPCCLKEYCEDGSHAGPWYREKVKYKEEIKEIKND